MHTRWAWRTNDVYGPAFTDDELVGIIAVFAFSFGRTLRVRRMRKVFLDIRKKLKL